MSNLHLREFWQATRQFDAPLRTRATVLLQILWHLWYSGGANQQWVIDMAGGNPGRVDSTWRSPSSNPNLEYVYLVTHTLLHLSVGRTIKAEDTISCHFETICTSVLKLAHRVCKGASNWSRPTHWRGHFGYSKSQTLLRSNCFLSSYAIDFVCIRSMNGRL